MSREDPQLRIRLPIELKEKIEDASAQNSRSMNAEIVHRLDVSFDKEISTDSFLSAEDALKLAKLSQAEVSKVILRRTFETINKMARMGHSTIYVNLSDLLLEGLEDDDYLNVFDPTFSKLRELGYFVPETSWDADGFLVISSPEEL